MSSHKTKKTCFSREVENIIQNLSNSKQDCKKEKGRILVYTYMFLEDYIKRMRKSHPQTPQVSLWCQLKISLYFQWMNYHYHTRLLEKTYIMTSILQWDNSNVRRNGSLKLWLLICFIGFPEMVEKYWILKWWMEHGRDKIVISRNTFPRQNWDSELSWKNKTKLII